MAETCKLSFNNFFSYFAFSPLSKQLSATDRKIALFGTILLGLSLGVGHLVCRLFFYNKKVAKIVKNSNSQTKKAAEVAEKQGVVRNKPQQLPKNIAEQIASHLKDRAPKNALEYIAGGFMMGDPKSLEDPINKKYYMKNMALEDELLLQPYVDRENSKAGGTSTMVTSLLSIYFGNMEKGVCLTSSGEYLGKSAKDAIAYSYAFAQGCEPEGVYNLMKSLLTLEFAKNQGARPQKIFVPISLNKDGIHHEILLVIEPSAKELRQARITVINSHGNSLSMYREYELAALKAASEIYSSDKTVAIRNTKRFYTTAYSCTHDLVETARLLANAPNAQELVKKGLPVRTAKDDKKVRLEHANDLLKFYQSYF